MFPFLPFFRLVEAILTLNPACLTSIATSNWLRKLGKALGLLDTREITFVSDRWKLAEAFELVAIATIEDATRTGSKQHTAGSPQRDRRHWDMIKTYPQRSRPPRNVFGDALFEKYWFKALDSLLEYTSDAPLHQSFPVSRDEATNLVNLYVVSLKVDFQQRWPSSTFEGLSSEGHTCSHLKNYLVAHNLYLERRSPETPSLTPTSILSTRQTASTAVSSPT